MIFIEADHSREKCGFAASRGKPILRESRGDVSHFAGPLHFFFFIWLNSIDQAYVWSEDEQTHAFTLDIKGFFTELDSKLVLTINPQHLERLELVLQDCEWHAASEDLAILANRLKVTTVEKIK